MPFLPLTATKYYAGIGSRSTPDEILMVMRDAALMLADQGWTLRSGGATGADTAFEQGCRAARHFTCEVYLPWASFDRAIKSIACRDEPEPAAYAIAEQFHPAWDRLSQGAKRLHARNVHQILGAYVEQPVLSKFVLCWTPNGSGSGGTGQAIRIAKAYGVPVFDMGDATTYDRVGRWVYC